jgi:hypothetical protein
MTLQIADAVLDDKIPVLELSALVMVSAMLSLVGPDGSYCAIFARMLAVTIGLTADGAVAFSAFVIVTH